MGMTVVITGILLLRFLRLVIHALGITAMSIRALDLNLVLSRFVEMTVIIPVLLLRLVLSRFVEINVILLYLRLRLRPRLALSILVDMTVILVIASIHAIRIRFNRLATMSAITDAVELVPTMGDHVNNITDAPTTVAT